MKEAPEYMAPFRKAHAILSEAPAQTSCFWMPGSSRDQFYFYSYTNRCWTCDPTSYPPLVFQTQYVPLCLSALTISTHSFTHLTLIFLSTTDLFHTCAYMPVCLGNYIAS